jgi:hypothetical protein
MPKYSDQNLDEFAECVRAAARDAIRYSATGRTTANDIALRADVPAPIVRRFAGGTVSRRPGEGRHLTTPDLAILARIARGCGLDVRVEITVVKRDGPAA